MYDKCWLGRLLLWILLLYLLYAILLLFDIDGYGNI
jgi:hypothetical protein